MYEVNKQLTATRITAKICDDLLMCTAVVKTHYYNKIARMDHRINLIISQTSVLFFSGLAYTIIHKAQLFTFVLLRYFPHT